jgi:small-conductance mechanosensitive channel/CRP-like cAMP-binding protein
MLERESHAMTKGPVRRLALPSILLIALLLPTLYWDTLILNLGVGVIAKSVFVLRYIIGISCWLVVAWFVIRVIDVFFWDSFVERKLAYQVPKLLKDLVRALVLFVTIAGIMGVVFEESLTGLLAASGILGLVIGFALRNMIADFFSGISLNLERSFKIGDWICLETGELGQVIEINWRATIIRNVYANTLVIPNSRMGAMKVENFSKPEACFRRYLEFRLDFDVPTERALRVLTASVNSIQQPIGDLRPDVLITDIDELGVKYRVRYLVPEVRQLPAKRTEVVRSVMHHLYLAGISPVHEKHDIFMSDMPVRQLDHHDNKIDLFKRIYLLKVLDDNELATLAINVIGECFKSGDIVVKQGDIGKSMYIIVEGILDVYIDFKGNGEEVKVAHMVPGDFFGEMSLLTGEPRSASVIAHGDTFVYEITKDDLQLLIENRPEIAAHITQTIAERRVREEVVKNNLTVEQQEIEVKSFAEQLLDRMGRFFNLLRGS